MGKPQDKSSQGSHCPHSIDILYVCVTLNRELRAGPAQGPREPAEARSELRPSGRGLAGSAAGHESGSRHSSRQEQRYFLLGQVSGGVLTVRFTRRGETVSIIGAGYWREGRMIYEEANRFRR
jgi:hypothetical protein